MEARRLDDIISALDSHRQRATYSAVAALIGETPRGLMRGKPREPGNSWIVSKNTGRPTGYADGDLHPALNANDKILMTGAELAGWLASH
ncbi:MAG TPA: hypothetical protein VH277_07375 [Gemmatimonadaceae bacterium]|jgi:hypothetical protein|nr:hypothetical protein [Gemmatimonadaceae bacterium]